MNSLRHSLVVVLLGASLQGQDAGVVPPTPPTVVEAAPGALASARRRPEELDQLLAPIALYPDALIALILPASTVPTDIVLAARHLRDNPADRAQIEHRAWDESVKSLTSYPEVVMWMDDNLDWTRQVGEAFASQPADVMQSVQRLRAKARAAGTLVDTPQQQVIAEPQVIRIVPAQPDIIYVPRYEPDVVFVDRPVFYSGSFLSFGIGVPVGSWLAFECDWRRNTIWFGNRHRRWTGQDWRRPVVPIPPTTVVTRAPEVRPWRPPPHAIRPPFSVAQAYRPEIVRPSPIGALPARPPAYRGNSFTEPRASADGMPAIPSLPGAINSRRIDYPGPRVGSTPHVTPTAPALAAPSVPAAPTVTAPPAVRSNPGWTRDNTPRERSYRAVQGTPPTALPSVPSLPMAEPVQRAAPMGPQPQQRVYSRAVPAPAPVNAPVPQAIPSMPMVNRGAMSAPTVGPVAPSVPAAPPAAAAPPPASRGGDNRPSRGVGRQEDTSATK